MIFVSGALSEWLRSGEYVFKNIVSIFFIFFSVFFFEKCQLKCRNRKNRHHIINCSWNFLPIAGCGTTFSRSFNWACNSKHLIEFKTFYSDDFEWNWIPIFNTFAHDLANSPLCFQLIGIQQIQWWYSIEIAREQSSCTVHRGFGLECVDFGSREVQFFANLLRCHRLNNVERFGRCSQFTGQTWKIKSKYMTASYSRTNPSECIFFFCLCPLYNGT